MSSSTFISLATEAAHAVDPTIPSKTGTETTAAEAATTTAQKAGLRRPSTFLCLTPSFSTSSCPARGQPKSLEISPPVATVSIAAEDVVAAAEDEEYDDEGVLVVRANSTASTVEKQRFLKLNPVFWGGAGEDDYAIEI